MENNRTYECMCLLDNREVRKGWEPVKSAVTALFTKHEAKILSSRRWDERRLAYTVNGQNRGTYLLVYFATDTQSITGLRRDLEFSETVMRYLITDCEEVPQGAYEPESEFDVNKIPGDDAPDDDEESDGPSREGSADEGSADGDSGKPEAGKSESGDDAAESEESN